MFTTEESWMILTSGQQIKAESILLTRVAVVLWGLEFSEECHISGVSGVIVDLCRLAELVVGYGQ